MWQELIAISSATGITVASVMTAGWLLLKARLQVQIEESVKNGFAESLEKSKTENAMIIEKMKRVSLALDQIDSLVHDVTDVILDFGETGGDQYINKIIFEIHPKFRNEFQKIRPKLEVNDILSSYSLMLGDLIHPENMKIILNRLEKKSRGNVRYIYCKVWLTTSEVLRSVDRVCGGYEFWSPGENYGERADAWAKFDFSQIMEFFEEVVDSREGRIGNNASEPFYISIEKDNGKKNFWENLPNSTAD